MKYFIFIIAVLLCQNLALSADATVYFRQTGYSNVFGLARSENKAVMLYFSLDGNPQCAKLEKSVFNVQKVAAYINENFVCIECKDVACNVSTNNGTNIYKVEKFPTILFLDDNRNILERIEGACSEQELMDQAKKALNPVEKLNVKSTDYSIRIEESRLRQSKTKYNYSYDSICYYGNTIKSALSSMLEIDENLITSNNDEIAGKQLFIYLYNYINSVPPNKNIIIEQLSKLYDFKIEKTKKKQEVWEMQIADSLKLMKHKSKAGGNTSNTHTSPLEIKIDNSDLKQISLILTSNFDKLITNGTGLNTRFDIIITRKDFSDLVTLLNNKYGLSMNKSEKELEYTNINFSKGK